MQRDETATPTVLFITDNGHGLGHITRMMAVAGHARGRFTPVFLTLSEGFPILREFGFPGEYLPSFRRLDVPKERWQPLFASRVRALLGAVHPSVVVIDHVVPPTVLADVAAGSPGIRFVWSRRGMWREGRNEHILPMFEAFDMIVEPGDLAAPLDRGLTTRYRRNVTAVPPIVLVSDDDQLGREEARTALGIPEVGRAVLISLSDSDPVKLASLISNARDVIRDAAGPEDVHLFAPMHALHGDGMASVDGVLMRPVYPVARYLRAFDGVVSTAGYNSFHEVVASGIPAVFVARDTDSLDDQRRRALFGELCGRTSHAASVGDGAFRRGVRRMLTPGEALVTAEVTKELGSFDGAANFADLIAEACGASVAGLSDRESGGSDGAATWSGLESMRGLSRRALRAARRVAVVAVSTEGEALVELVEQLSNWREGGFRSKPVLVVDSTVDQAVLHGRRLHYETVMTADEWPQLATGHETYMRLRIAELEARGRPGSVLVVGP